MPISVWIGSFLVVTAIGLAWWAAASSRRTRASANLAVQSTDLREMVLARGAGERVGEPGLQKLGEFARAITPTGVADRIEQKLDAAGAPAAWPVERVLGMKLLSTVGFGFLGILIWLGDPSNVRNFVLAIIFAAIGFLLPDMLLNAKASSRNDRIRRELPDVLDQITISVEAGLGFEAALAHVANHTEGPVAEEFQRALHDIRLGRSREEAFGSMAKRSDVEELRHFVVSLEQAERLGVPIAEVLRVQAGEMRVIRRQRAEENAQKLPVKMIFPLILCILPALIAVVLGPAIFELIDNFPRI
ncbi:MAG: type II secretion system F family protein [Acidimicrobiia bacterium]|nr:type II secretion system F family protein [Acidimicrobiia bacterium]